jgi:hypothetical protein
MSSRSDITFDQLRSELEINSLFASLSSDQKMRLMNAGSQIVCDLYRRAGRAYLGDNLGTNALTVINVVSDLVSKFFSNKMSGEVIIINFGADYPVAVREDGDYNDWVKVFDHSDRDSELGCATLHAKGSFTVNVTNDNSDIQVLIAPLN